MAAGRRAAPYGLIAWFGGQVAASLAMLALARSLRYRAEGGVVPSDRLADIYRPTPWPSRVRE